MSQKKIVLYSAIFIFVLLIGILTANETIYEKEYIDGNILNLAVINTITADAGQIDSPWKNQQFYIQLLYRTLFISDPTFTSVENDLVKKYSVSSDGLTYTITLKDDVIWSDGIPLTIDDVVFSIESIFQTNDGNSLYTSAFHHIIGVDEFLENTELGISGLETKDNTLIMHLDTPCYNMLQMLAQFVILPKHCLETADLVNLSTNDFWKHPIVNGMYMITEFIPGEYFKLERNSYYSEQKPNIDEVYLHINYQEIKLDLYSTNATMDMVNYRSMQGYSEHLVDMLFYRYFIFNIEGIDGNENESMEDIRVRQAIAYALDTESLLYDVYFNTGTIIDSGVPHVGADHDILAYTYNPTKAKDLLESADYDFSDPIRIAYYYTDEYTTYFISEVSKDLEAVGFTVESFYAANGAADLFYERDYDIALKGLAAFDISEWYNEYVSTHLFFTNIIGNEGLYDDLLLQLTQATNTVSYDALLYRLESLEQNHLYKLPLFTLNQYVYTYDTRLYIPSNVVFGNTWYRYDMQYEDWRIKKE